MFQFYLNKSHYSNLKKKTLYITKNQGDIQVHNEIKSVSLEASPASLNFVQNQAQNLIIVDGFLSMCLLHHKVVSKIKIHTDKCCFIYLQLNFYKATHY